jgi:hypothetical protein
VPFQPDVQLQTFGLTQTPLTQDGEHIAKENEIEFSLNVISR